MKFPNQRDYPHWLYITRTDTEGEDKEWGKIVLCDGGTIAEEAYVTNVPYCLFWR